jgi:vanillate O-demethylase monooxygenase subunit
VPLSPGHVEGNEIICKYHGLRYDRNGKCTCIPAHPNGTILPRLRLDMFSDQERYGLVWVRLVDEISVGGREPTETKSVICCRPQDLSCRKWLLQVSR